MESVTFHITESPHRREEVRKSVLTSSGGYRQADSKDGAGSHSNSLRVPAELGFSWLTMAGAGLVSARTAAPERWL